ncbi:MAG: hypothetical protein Q8N81_03760, partial [bacterium]|nr:hypothetical protein [bacterium]
MKPIIIQTLFKRKNLCRYKYLKCRKDAKTSQTASENISFGSQLHQSPQAKAAQTLPRTRPAVIRGKPIQTNLYEQVSFPGTLLNNCLTAKKAALAIKTYES